MAEGGVAGAEVVDRDLAAEIAHDRDEARRILEIVQRRGLGDLDDQPVGELGAVLEARDQGTQPAAVGGGDAGDVEGKGDLRVRLQGLQRQVEGAPVERAHQSQALDHGNETAGRNQLALRRIHAQQALVGAHLMAHGIDDGLIGEDQPVVLHRLGHLLAQFHVGPVAAALLLRHAVGLDAIAPGRLGLEQGALGLGDDVEAGLGLFGKEHHADRHGGVHARAVGDDHALTDRLDDPFGDHHRVLVRAVAQHHAKTVAAQAPDHVGGAQSLIQALGDLDQDPVSGLASEGGVDLVELVDADRQEGA